MTHRTKLLFALVATLYIANAAPLSATIPQFCQNWTTLHDCWCNQVAPWSWTGGCDFSEENEPLMFAAEYCDSHFGECSESCESSAYRNYLAQLLCSETPGSCDPGCYATWADTDSCNAGEVSDFACACGYFFWCEG